MKSVKYLIQMAHLKSWLTIGQFDTLHEALEAKANKIWRIIKRTTVEEVVG